MAGLHRSEVERAYRAYGYSVQRRARSLLGDVHEAGEVVHDVFVSLLEPRPGFGGRSSLATYLYAVTTNICLNKLRDGRNRERLLALHAGAAPSGSSPPRPDAWVELRRILVGLPDDEARAAVYHYVDGMSHREVAEMLGCSRRHVGDLLERLRARMEERMQEVAR